MISECRVTAPFIDLGSGDHSRTGARGRPQGRLEAIAQRPLGGRGPATCVARHRPARSCRPAAVVDASASRRSKSTGLGIRSVECARTLLYLSSQAAT